MIYDSPLFGDARGKLGNMIFSRNASGPYIRPFKVPANPKSYTQTLYRAILSYVASLWSTLSDSQRLGWNILATTQQTTNSLGKPSRQSGFNLFVRLNMNQLFITGAYIHDAPTNPQVPPGLNFTSAVCATDPYESNTGTITLTVDPSGPPPGGFTTYYVHQLRSLGTSFWARNLFATTLGVGLSEYSDHVVIQQVIPNYPPATQMKFAVGWRNVDLSSGFTSQQSIIIGLTT